MEKSHRDISHAVGAALGKPGVAALKICPFCKGGTLQGIQSTNEDGTAGTFAIECQICGASGPPADDLAHAGKRWNLRLR